jgi:hypothetical protein
MMLAAVAGGAAQPAEPPAEPPARQESLIVYGDDPCPAAEDEDEIVVCARRPEEERYRIPAPLRRGDRLSETAWTSQVDALEEAQRDSRPNSCSVVGSFGQSGCSQEMLRRWHAERRAAARAREREP